MRLLFDQNLSTKLCNRLADIFPGSSHVRLVGLSQADDRIVWEFARAHGFAVVTLDSDFAELAAVLGAPPKIVWLRCGNRSTDYVEALMRRAANAMFAFNSESVSVCLEIY